MIEMKHGVHLQHVMKIQCLLVGHSHSQNNGSVLLPVLFWEAHLFSTEQLLLFYFFMKVLHAYSLKKVFKTQKIQK